MSAENVIFDADDVFKVARAMVENHGYMTFDPDTEHCLHCNGESHVTFSDGKYRHTIEHDHDCPVLIAKDLLTGSTG